MNQLESTFQRLAEKAAAKREEQRLKRLEKTVARISRKQRPLPSRDIFVGRILSFALIESHDSCWNWTGGLDDCGYGRFNMFQETLAHRACWYLFRGEIGESYVCHSCDNRRCINPCHLFLGTQLDNMRDCRDKGRNGGPIGEEVNTAVLREQDVLELREVYELHRRTQEWPILKQKLSERFQVGILAIQRSVTGVTWKHLQKKS